MATLFCHNNKKTSQSLQSSKKKSLHFSNSIWVKSRIKEFFSNVFEKTYGKICCNIGIPCRLEKSQQSPPLKRAKQCRFRLRTSLTHAYMCMLHARETFCIQSRTLHNSNNFQYTLWLYEWLLKVEWELLFHNKGSHCRDGIIKRN